MQQWCAAFRSPDTVVGFERQAVRKHNCRLVQHIAQSSIRSISGRKLAAGSVSRIRTQQREDKHTDWMTNEFAILQSFEAGC
jgi:hypothetical protein